MHAESWERFCEIREPCPGCQRIGTRARHRLCRRRRRRGGYILQCRSLTSDPAAAPSAWKHLGQAPQQCAAFFVPDSSSAPPPTPRPKRPDPEPRCLQISPEEGRERLRWRWRYAAQFHKAKRDLAAKFYSERRVPFDLRLYTPGPSRREAADLAAWLLDRQEPHGFWGYSVAKGKAWFSTDESGEVWEWILDIKGREIGYSRRIIKPKKDRPRARLPKGGKQHVHHSLECREAIARTDTLIITEGMRKANETSRRTGFAALGLPGVSIGRIVAEELRQSIRDLRPRRILLAPDSADMVDGEQRHDPTRRDVDRWKGIVEQAIKEAEPDAETQLLGIGWDPTAGKGIDDVLAALNHEDEGLPNELEVLLWEEHLSRWEWSARPKKSGCNIQNRVPEDPAPASAENRQPEPAPPAPEATQPLVRTADEAFAASAKVVHQWVPGKQSLLFCGWPGLGKTTAAGENVAKKLAETAKGWTSRVAVISLPRRHDVHEKAATLRKRTENLGIETDIVELLGRSSDPQSGWYCEAGEFDAERLNLRVELQRHVCVGCELRDDCKMAEGRFLHERRDVLDQVKAATKKQAPPVVIVTTHASLPWLLRDLPKRSLITIDDAGETFGLLREIVVRREDLLDAAMHAREFARTRDLDDELDWWRRWNTASEGRGAARAALKQCLKEAEDGSAAASAAASWAERVGGGLNPAQTRHVVETHWRPDKPIQILRRLDPLVRAIDRLPDGLAADLVAHVLDAFSWPHGTKGAKHDRVREAVEALPPEYLRAIECGKVRPPRNAGGSPVWPWEVIGGRDGHDLRASFARMALDAAREVILTGSGPLVHRVDQRIRSRSEPDYTIYMPVRDLIERARKGRVLWTAVGPMPPQLLESLGARQEVVLASPRQLRAVVCEAEMPADRETGRTRVLSLGTGNRKGGEPSPADEMTRAFVRGLAEASRNGNAKLGDHCIRHLGGVLHKADREILEEAGQEAPAAVDPESVLREVDLRHFGAGHAATDDLADCDTLVVRRFVPRFDGMLRTAEALRRSLELGGDPILLHANPKDGPSRVTVETRTWLGDPLREEIHCRALAHPLAREVQRFHETALQLNAVGRCRPLSADEPRLVLLLAGRPFDWLAVERRDFYGVARELGMQVALPTSDARQRVLDDYNERQAQAALDRQCQLQDLLGSRRDASLRELAATLRASERTVRRDLVALQEAGERPEAPIEWLWDTLEELLGERSASGHPSDKSTSIQRVARNGTGIGGRDEPLSLKAVVKATEMAGEPVPKTSAHRLLKRIRTALTEGSGPPPAPRSTELRNLRVVLETVIDLLERALLTPAGPTGPRPAPRTPGQKPC